MGAMNALRLFVAAYPSPGIAAELAAAAASYAPASARLISPDQIHLTLLFIGSVRVSNVERIAESLDRAASGRQSSVVRLHTLACLPQTGDPRLVAALADADGPTLELQRRIASRLVTWRPKASGDNFSPHLTLARLQPATSAREAQPIMALDLPLRSIRLMRSSLRPGGAIHSVVHETMLE